ncbi:hypothetical protein AYO38_04720 [bacterium SCGC AG-212-C10]|nr:hypothetical protein AYO38_04720 [bacterium SCGC AG-212-C10]
MYLEPGPHHLPHFHAYYQDHTAVFSLATLDMLAGSLPIRQRRLVEAWAELHLAELEQNWSRIQSGNGRRPIDPLH